MVVCLLVGIPGSGKSTWAYEMSISLRQVDATSTIISRDKIRKDFVGENVDKELYFGRETDVFNEFVDQINQAMKDYDCVFTDATHISPVSRRKIISRLIPPENAQLLVHVMKTPFDECMKRNAERKGFAFVPETAMYRMNRQFIPPTKNEFEANWNPFKETILSSICQ